MLFRSSLAIANTLWREPLVREALVAQTEQLNGVSDSTQTSPTDSGQTAMQNLQEIQSLSLPIGWTADNVPAIYTEDGKVNNNYANAWILKVGGILLSGIVAAQGARYWFDIVRKFLGGRSSKSAKQEEGK